MEAHWKLCASLLSKEVVMKNHVKFLVISFVCFLFARSSVSFGQVNIYPLHVGDRWEYHDFGLLGVRIPKDTLMPNGQRYFVLETYSGHLNYSQFHRTNGNQVYMYYPEANSDELWFDFTRSNPDTIAVYPRGTDTTTIVFYDLTTVNLFGQNRRQWYFGIDYTRRLLDDEESIRITEGIGVTTFERAWEWPEITGAIVNGIQYGTITGIKDRHSPTSFELRQNYPNPFNPSTTIRFGVSGSGFVSLKVFDTLGREVATLVDEEKTPGKYSVTFDASNLSSGIYYYRLHTGVSNSIKKLIVLR
jgi:hypothetical protein